ncbi:hypothetical protein Agub_g6411 [Astrephomene gubernaculifera]|uniref:Uncharacterized protein n=1 Tax=Astrephomene gubernaculifera TaxID=47775 RepID=A0AAD3DNB4_9CHLO|nr:hypothetical protein Agub_g6411 [Astrephomene gubernaculifera]
METTSTGCSSRRSPNDDTGNDSASPVVGVLGLQAPRSRCLPKSHISLDYLQRQPEETLGQQQTLLTKRFVAAGTDGGCSTAFAACHVIIPSSSSVGGSPTTNASGTQEPTPSAFCPSDAGTSSRSLRLMRTAARQQVPLQDESAPASQQQAQQARTPLPAGEEEVASQEPGERPTLQGAADAQLEPLSTAAAAPNPGIVTAADRVREEDTGGGDGGASTGGALEPPSSGVRELPPFSRRPGAAVQACTPSSNAAAAAAAAPVISGSGESQAQERSGQTSTPPPTALNDLPAPQPGFFRAPQQPPLRSSSFQAQMPHPAAQLNPLLRFQQHQQQQWRQPLPQLHAQLPQQLSGPQQQQQQQLHPLTLGGTGFPSAAAATLNPGACTRAPSSAAAAAGNGCGSQLIEASIRARLGLPPKRCSTAGPGVALGFPSSSGAAALPAAQLGGLGAPGLMGSAAAAAGSSLQQELLMLRGGRQLSGGAQGSLLLQHQQQRMHGQLEGSGELLPGLRSPVSTGLPLTAFQAAGGLAAAAAASHAPSTTGMRAGLLAGAAGMQAPLPLERSHSVPLAAADTKAAAVRLRQLEQMGVSVSQAVLAAAANGRFNGGGNGNTPGPVVGCRGGDGGLGCGPSTAAAAAGGGAAATSGLRALQSTGSSGGACQAGKRSAAAFRCEETQQQQEQSPSQPAPAQQQTPACATGPGCGVRVAAGLDMGNDMLQAALKRRAVLASSEATSAPGRSRSFSSSQLQQQQQLQGMQLPRAPFTRLPQQPSITINNNFQAAPGLYLPPNPGYSHAAALGFGNSNTGPSGVAFPGPVYVGGPDSRVMLHHPGPSFMAAASYGNMSPQPYGGLGGPMYGNMGPVPLPLGGGTMGGAAAGVGMAGWAQVSRGSLSSGYGLGPAPSLSLPLPAPGAGAGAVGAAGRGLDEAMDVACLVNEQDYLADSDLQSFIADLCGPASGSEQPQQQQDATAAGAAAAAAGGGGMP